jgi:hypothetical protein
MSLNAPKKIPAWIRNVRSQIHTLASDGLIRTAGKELQWEEVQLEVGPFDTFLMLNTASEALAVRMSFGSVSDTSAIENLFDGLPFPEVEIMYNFEPVSKLWIFRELYLSETSTKEEIYAFLKECTLISTVGLQTLIARDLLVEPTIEVLATYGLDRDQRNWGNTSDSDKLLSGIGY